MFNNLIFIVKKYYIIGRVHDIVLCIKIKHDHTLGAFLTVKLMRILLYYGAF